ncbi:MAG: DVUA0089 family protein, partial [Burkholderiaceae bacterium]
MNRLVRVFAHLLVLCAISSSHAESLVFSGRLDDPANAALVGSDLNAPSFIDSGTIANNVALYTLNVFGGGPVTIRSTGFTAGGLDPYFSLFKGAGNSAT